MHTSKDIQGQAIHLQRNKKRWQLTGWLLAAIVVLYGEPMQASVVEFTGGPTTTQTDAEVYFSPLSGQVWTSYSDTALFGIANVSGNLAIAFNTTPDGTLVVAPNRVNPSLSTVARLSSGAVVGTGSLFDNAEYTLAESDGLIGNWNGLGSGFFGFRFGTGTDVHYGWASITVLPNYNITLNSFAYETVSGQPITVAATPVPEPSSFAFVGICGVLGLLFGLRRRLSRRSHWANLAAGLVAVSTVLSAQTSTPLPGQTDPVGSHLMQFRSDHLFGINAYPSGSNTVLYTEGLQYSSNPFNISFSDTSVTQTSSVSGRQWHTVSGHFLQPDHEDVVLAYANGSSIDVQVVGQSAANITLPTSVLPRYTATLPNGSTQPTVDFIAIAAGDLDHAVDKDGNYHDEVVIAYATAQNTYDVVVLDYSENTVNPNTGNVQVTQPNVVEFQALEGLQFNPAMMINADTSQSPPGHVLPYDNIVSLSVGDFDGDGVAEIAVDAIKYQPTQGNNSDTKLSVQTLRYRPEVQSIYEIGIFDLLPPLIQVGSNTQQSAFLGANLTMTSGDYEGRGADDVALGYLAYGPSLSLNQVQQIYPTSVIHLLNASTQTQQIVANLNPSGNPSQPSRLTLSGISAGSIPQQLTISSAQNTSSPGNTSWNVLNGTWQTTLIGTGNGNVSISIPVDTSKVQSGEGNITVVYSKPLGPANGSTPLQITENPFSNSDPDTYLRLQLVSGLFQYNPPTWDFSRRQFAVILNSSLCQSTCSNTNYSILASWFSVSSNQGGNLQFNQGGTTKITPPAGAVEAAQRVAATAGAFRGNTIFNSSPTLPPIWSLAINAWYDNGQNYVYILEPNGNGGFSVASQSVATGSVDSQARLAVVNYDSNGSSVFLGAPIHLTASNLVTPTTILKEPPKHLAWSPDLSKCSPGLSGPGICNINRNDGFNVQFKDTLSNQVSTSTQQQKSSDFSTTDSISASLSVKTTVFPGISNKFSISDTATFGYDQSHTDSSYYSSNGKVTYKSGAETDHDDFLQVQTQNLDVWRYRVYYSTNPNAPSGYTFYDLTYPSSPVDVSTPGLANDWYNPVHENGNVLSYSPQPPSGNPYNGLPDDVGPPYTVLPAGGSPSMSTNGVLYSGTGFCFGGISGAQTISLTGVTSSGDTVETSKTNSWDNDTQVGDTFKVGGSKISTSADADLGQQQSLSQSTASDNTTTGSTSVTFNVDAGENTNGYTIYPVFYNSNAGVLKFQQYVSIPTAASTGTCSEGGKWWTDNYGGAPDPALNLPFRFSFSSYDASTDTTTWDLQTDLERERLRSFFLTSATADQNQVYTPLATNPAEGSTVRMAVRVYNFSLGQAAQNVTVQFSVMPYDGNADNELGCGTPGSGETGRYCAPNARTVLGTTTISSIPAWGGFGPDANWQMAEYSWSIPSGFMAAHQNASEFRVYVNLSIPGNNELNPPQAPCNSSPASNPEPCPSQIAVHPSDPNWNPNAPGQNNEGFSYITLQPAPGPSAQASSALTMHNMKAASVLRAALNGEPQQPFSAANLKTVPDSLAAVDPAGQLKSGLVVAYLGRPLHVRVKAQSEINEVQELHKARVFDGAGPAQKVIALKALRGVKFAGTSAWFHWTPTTLGLHQLTAEILEPQEDLTKGDNTAKLSVIVVRAPGDVNGDGSVDALDTEIIREQIGKATAESKCGTACDLNGDGHIGPADLELATAHCDHSSCAVSHTLPPKGKKKQNQ
jgi:hypothetical protein